MPDLTDEPDDSESLDDLALHAVGDADADLEMPVCPYCFEPLPLIPGWQAPFCPACGGPVTVHAATDPLGQVFALGRAYSNATGMGSEPEASARPASTSKRRIIITLGMWLIIAPAMLTLLMPVFFGVAHIVGTPTAEYPINSVVGTLAALALFMLYGVILWKVTRRRRLDHGTQLNRASNSL